MPGWLAIAEPVTAPYPVTTLNMPGGKPACSTSFANSSVDADACSDGFTTTAFPAASAAARLNESSSSGEFHGMMMPTTPIGSRSV